MHYDKCCYSGVYNMQCKPRGQRDYAGDTDGKKKRWGSLQRDDIFAELDSENNTVFC